MSEEAHAEPTAEGEGAEGKPAKGPNKLMLPIVVALMTVAGGLVGVWVVGPKLSARAHMQAGLEAEPAGKESHEEGKEGEGSGEKGPVFKLDNLIVNPSGSQGARFLMVSVAIETIDGKQDEELRAKEAQIRDLVITLLEKETMETLGTPGIRDSLKAQLSDTISAIAGSKTKLHVFLPQFVIQ